MHFTISDTAVTWLWHVSS